MASTRNLAVLRDVQRCENAIIETINSCCKCDILPHILRCQLCKCFGNIRTDQRRSVIRLSVNEWRHLLSRSARERWLPSNRSCVRYVRKVCDYYVQILRIIRATKHGKRVSFRGIKYRMRSKVWAKGWSWCCSAVRSWPLLEWEHLFLLVRSQFNQLVWFSQFQMAVGFTG